LSIVSNVQSVARQVGHTALTLSPRATRYQSAWDQLRTWIESQAYRGFEPYDLLNSPYLQGRILRGAFIAPLIIQAGRRLGGLTLRCRLKVQPSLNPKALALCLSAYCDLMKQGIECRGEALSLRDQLLILRSPNEETASWGYDWDFCSLRGAKLPKFSPNSIVTCFVANALLDLHETIGDGQSLEMAQSAGQFIVGRLTRSLDSQNQVCFSYTPGDRTRIYNSSVIAGALLLRLANVVSSPETYTELASRSMRYLAEQQRLDGSWPYGASRLQQWVDGFHTGYNLCALLEYRQSSGDTTFDRYLDHGYEFYKRFLMCKDGSAKHRQNKVFPIDIHACSQAILTFCLFRNRDNQAMEHALRTADWTLDHMRSPEGTFYYQRHRWRTDGTPYMRWGQAWMFRALASLTRALNETAARGQSVPRVVVGGYKS
jgi:hypothetical protein